MLFMKKHYFAGIMFPLVDQVLHYLSDHIHSIATCKMLSCFNEKWTPRTCTLTTLKDRNFVSSSKTTLSFKVRFFHLYLVSVFFSGPSLLEMKFWWKFSQVSVLWGVRFLNQLPNRTRLEIRECDITAADQRVLSLVMNTFCARSRASLWLKGRPDRTVCHSLKPPKLDCKHKSLS